MARSARVERYHEPGSGRASGPPRGTVAVLAFAIMSGVDLHQDLESIAFLLGTWTGEGAGDYPTSSSFRYREETTFSHVGEPWIAYTQRTWSLDDGEFVHMEHGFLRNAGGGAIELVMSYPLGMVEVAEGTVAEGAPRVSIAPPPATP